MTSLTYRLYIDGTWQDSEGDAVLTVLNPATEEVIGAVPDGTAGDVNRAVAAARRAFDEGPWPNFSPRERAAVLLRMADAMERRAGELKELAVREAGSTRALADTLQVNIPLLHFRDMAERVLPQFPFEKPMPPTVGATLAQGVVRREPYGVAALISAYNFPLFLNILKLAPALAAGCTVVLKPAPTTPLEAFVLGEMADEAGLPPGVLNIVTGDAAAGQALTTHPGVDIVSFTGSDAVGRLVYAQAAPSLKKVVLELGGKSANIITADADLGRVVQTVMFAMTTHAGQGCSLLTRTLVHRSRLDELVSLVKAALDKVKVGNPADPDVTMGPLISAAQREKVEGLIRTGQAEGAQIAYGGGTGGPGQGLLRRADTVRRCRQRDDHRQEGVLRPGRRGHRVRRRRRGRAAGQRQRVRARRRRLGQRPGARLRDRQADQGRDGVRQRRRRRVEPAHRLRRLQAERARPGTRGVRT